jgi:hypothetical protein
VAGWPDSHIDIVHLTRRHAWLQRHGGRGDLRDVGVWWAFQRAACRDVSGGRHPRARKWVRTVPGYARERAVRKGRTILASPCTFDLLERGHSKYKQLCSQTVPQKPSGIEVVLLVFGSACHPVVFPARFWVRAAITGQIVSSQLFVTVCRTSVGVVPTKRADWPSTYYHLCSTQQMPCEEQAHCHATQASADHVRSLDGLENDEGGVGGRSRRTLRAPCYACLRRTYEHASCPFSKSQAIKRAVDPRVRSTHDHDVGGTSATRGTLRIRSMFAWEEASSSIARRLDDELEAEGYLMMREAAKVQPVTHVTH